MKKKKLFTLIGTFLFILGFSQSQIKKWNSTLNRFDYIDARGNLVAYEQFNKVFNQWEYFDIGSNSRSANNLVDKQKRNYQELESPSLTQSEINYAQNIANAELLTNNVNRENVIYYNQRIIQNKYDELRAKINSFNLNSDTKQKFIDEFNTKVLFADANFIDLSSKTTALEKLNFLVNSYNELLRKYVNK